MTYTRRRVGASMMLVAFILVTAYNITCMVLKWGAESTYHRVPSQDNLQAVNGYVQNAQMGFIVWVLLTTLIWLQFREWRRHPPKHRDQQHGRHHLHRF